MWGSLLSILCHVRFPIFYFLGDLFLRLLPPVPIWTACPLGLTARSFFSVIPGISFAFPFSVYSFVLVEDIPREDIPRYWEGHNSEIFFMSETVYSVLIFHCQFLWTWNKRPPAFWKHCLIVFQLPLWLTTGTCWGVIDCKLGFSLVLCNMFVSSVLKFHDDVFWCRSFPSYTVYTYELSKFSK